MNMALSIPPGCETNFNDEIVPIDQPINENISGEESKETSLSNSSRVRGDTFVGRSGLKR